VRRLVSCSSATEMVWVFPLRRLATLRRHKFLPIGLTCLHLAASFGGEVHQEFWVSIRHVRGQRKETKRKTVDISFSELGTDRQDTL